MTALITVRVILILLVWLAIFLAMFLGYFTVPIIVVGVISLIFALVDVGFFFRAKRVEKIREKHAHEYEEQENADQQKPLQ